MGKGTHTHTQTDTHTHTHMMVISVAYIFSFRKKHRLKIYLSAKYDYLKYLKFFFYLMRILMYFVINSSNTL
jgi:hypothetical protein